MMHAKICGYVKQIRVLKVQDIYHKRQLYINLQQLHKMPAKFPGFLFRPRA